MKVRSPSLDEEDLSDSHHHHHDENSDENISDHSNDGNKRITRNGKKRTKSTTSELSDESDDGKRAKQESSRKNRNSIGSTSPSQKKKPTRRMIDKTKKQKQEEEKKESEDEEEYEVETILLSKKKKNKMHYLVKWKGWRIEDSTWEPPENLSNIPDLIEHFEKHVAPTLDKNHNGNFVPEKILNSRKVKNKTEYLVQWRDYPVKTWEPDTSLRRSLISKYRSESGIRFQKITGGKSIASSSKESSDSETQHDSDPEIPEPPSKKQKNPSPPLTPTSSSSSTSTPTSSSSSKSKNIQTISEKDLADMDFTIISVKKKNNSFQAFLKDAHSGTQYLVAIKSLRSNEKHLQKLVDYLLSKIVFDSGKKKNEEY
ncbi:hypothetical protein C9374_001423 [Naegleria lovaniensis]|uniref:Chromo domain-containing protein n=1 Tax=Naegleria lovaniensis TaxID=51637 RepID=A0AA88GY65_NAELO|nr:uncharacterized protein C9374_001423 [Naegleria lovaniensis]KAG2387829.1 hypothetical protein C9374_001423 [Naegleria lovaniensis]